MAYCYVTDVKNLNAHLFSQTTAPADEAVEDWMEQGAQVIDTELAGLGYSTPAPSTAALYAELRGLNAMYAAAMCEMSRLIATERTVQTREEVMTRRFYQKLDSYKTKDLTAAGLTHTSYAYAGGISTADKDAVEAETDRPMTTFKRGQFIYPGSGMDVAT